MNYIKWIFLFQSVLIGGLPVMAKNKQPNVLFILVDDLGWMDVSVMGSQFYQTPHIDKLAEKGVLFTDAYAACTVCSPSRASIMTGKYPANLNCTDWIEGYQYPYARLLSPEWTMYLDTMEYTLAEAFNANGYATGHVGKWHLGESSVYWPQNQGFDVNIGGWAKGSPQLRKNKGYNGYFPPFGNPELPELPGDTYLTERLANEACGFLEAYNPEKTGQPFYLNLWFYTVHTPLQAKDDKIAKYRELVDERYHQINPVYAAMVEHMDEAVGKVMTKLETEGLMENTIIVFTSDNGGLVGRGNWHVTSNQPLRNGKGHMYEGGIRVPLIIADPRVKDKQGIKTDYPAISCDFYPTLIELADLKVPKKVKKAFDGISLRSLINQANQKERDALFWHYPHYHTEGAEPYSAVRHGEWKLIRFFETDRYELYNLKQDISETNDLSALYPDKVAYLKELLFNWYDKVGAQMPVENPDYNAEKQRSF